MHRLQCSGALRSKETTIQSLASKQLPLPLPSLKAGLVVTHNSILSKTEATEREGAFRF